MNSDSEDKLAPVVKEKRFFLQRNTEARNKLASVQAAFREYMVSNPEVIGMTLMGSNASGKVHEASDLDCFVFVDGDHEHQRHMTHSQARRARLKRAVAAARPYGNELTLKEYQVSEVYRHDFVLMAKQAGFLKAKSDKDIRVRYLTEKTLRRDISQFVCQCEQYYARKDNFEQWYNNYGEAIANDDTEQKRHLRNNEPEFPYKHKSVKLPWKYQALFYLSIGRGLDKYRSIILDVMDQSRYGDRMWNEYFVSSMVEAEYNVQSQPHKSYPLTIATARQHFHIY